MNHTKQHSEQFQCSYCDTIFNTIVLLDEHIENTCLLVPVNCPLKSCGCETKVHYYRFSYDLVYISFIDPATRFAPTLYQCETSDKSSTN